MSIVSDFTGILSGSTWYSKGEHGTPLVLSYSFPEHGPAHPGLIDKVSPGSFTPFSDAEKNTVRAALKQWGDASGLTFIETSLNGDIQFGNYDLSGVSLPGGGRAGGASDGIMLSFSGSNGAMYPFGFESKNIFISSDVLVSNLLGTSLHEIGHSIGLKHSFESSALNDAILSATADNKDETVMSYTSGTHPVTALGPLDLQAAEYLYGPPSSDGKQFTSWSWDAGSQTFHGTGTSSDDMIRGLNTKNDIHTGDGNDLVATGEYDDVIVCGNGDDKVASGAGNDVITVGSGSDWIKCGDGDDVVKLSGNAATVFGDDGFDIVFAGRTETPVKLDTTGNWFFSVISPGKVDWFQGVERVFFSNSLIALDVNGNAGEAYRMYQAAFARTPDQDGVSYWVSQVDKGLSLHDLAQSFIGSAEFQSIYGASPTVDKLVTGFYTNVLGRAPDSSGLSYWVAQVQSGLSTAGLLVNFSESAENKAHVAPAIQNGIELSLSYFS